MLETRSKDNLISEGWFAQQDETTCFHSPESGNSDHYRSHCDQNEFINGLTRRHTELSQLCTNDVFKLPLPQVSLITPSV